MSLKIESAHSIAHVLSEALPYIQRFRGKTVSLGLITLPLMVPVLNLLVPILGAATFTHLFHALETRRPAA